MTCPNCSAPLPADAMFCPRCGTPVQGHVATRERKTVTVLFADLVDSTRLTRHHDAERVREVLAAFYDAASEELLALRGHPEKFVGDAVMAVFGLAGAHEDDAVRAVRAGLAIRARLAPLNEAMGLSAAPLELRIGIESGDVATGESPGSQLLVTGSTVNAAARLASAAGPNEVLVGVTTYELTRSAVSFGEPREVSARGFEGPLAAHPVQTLSTRSARRTIPLIDRRPELALLKAALDGVVSGGRPHLVTILGEAGVGKTRLVEELAAEVDEDTISVISRVQPPDWGSTFSPLTELLAELAGVCDDDTEAARASLQRIVDGDEPGASDPRRRAARLALTIGGVAQNSCEESTYIQEVQTGFVELIHELSQRSTVLLAFDRIELARPMLLDLIERLAGRSPRAAHRLLVTATGRVELLDSRPGFGAGAENHTTIRLGPLSVHNSVMLAQQATRGALSDELARAVAIRAGGNPFFIVEMTGMLERRGPGPPIRPGIAGEPALPPTVQALVASRLDHLPAGQRQLVRTVSVFVASFDLSELALVLPDRSADELEADLAVLEDAELLVRDQRPGSYWRFRHETLREVAYASVAKRDRLRLHVQIADGLTGHGHRGDWVADHLERAAFASLDLDPDDRTLPERAADALAQVADRARRRMDGRAATDRYTRCLALAGPESGWGRREARALAGMGEAQYWLGEYETARASLRRAEELAERVGDDLSLSVALRFRADILLNTDGDLDAAGALFDRSLAAAERSGDNQAITRTLLFAGWAPWTRDDFARADGLWARALDLARAGGDRWAEIRALSSLAVLRSDQDDYRAAGEMAGEAMRVATEFGDRFSLAVATLQLGRSLLESGRAEQAVPHIDRAVATFEELGARWEYADAMRTRGMANSEQGRLDEAEADLSAALRASRDLGERLLTSSTQRALAGIAARRQRAGADARS